ncbi:HlyD family secretion protein [Sutterella sp.]|uniref:HlyD family secretion protein n=1 Tax=Sutterella sp. TaxID=1981025 RepID=UPI0026DFE0D3|nr:HlyD family efflux transporter periplasmic adaptor subunit [Sutterella sp.]MDO5532428.1 HlyD family secretion protein [Sutterella sp.]
MALSQKQKKDITRTIGGFVIAGVAAAGLIYLGNRNDAVTEAESLKSGVLTAHEVRVAFESVSGRLIDRPIEEGRIVEAGEKLLGIDGTDVRLSIASTTAGIAQIDAQTALERESIALALTEADTDERCSWRSIEEAEANRKAAAANLENARAGWTRAQKLYPQGAMAQADYDSAKAAWVSARESLAVSERAVSRLSIGATKEELDNLRKTGSAEGMHLETIANARKAADNRRFNLENLAATRAQLVATLDQLKVNESRLVISSPERAKVLEVLFEKGELVSPGTPAVLLESERLYFDIYVPEAQAARFSSGTKVECASPALHRSYEGVVQTTDAAPDFATLRAVRERGQADTTLFRVRIDVKPDPSLLPGMTLEVKL